VIPGPARLRSSYPDFHVGPHQRRSPRLPRPARVAQSAGGL